MLESFEIRNFRLFQHLEVKKLNRVNLIVGKNNSGKSTFLEALKLYASNASATVLWEIIESRQESWISEARPYHQKFLWNPVRHLFFGHQLPSLEEEGIVLGEILLDTKINLVVAAYRRNLDREDEGLTRIQMSNISSEEDLSEIELVLIVEDNKKTRRILKIDREIREIRRTLKNLSGRQESEFKYIWQVVSTENMPDSKIASLWDLTSLTEMESEVLSALKIIEPRVTGVAFVENRYQKSILYREEHLNRIPLVKLKGIDEPLPLKSMGDGMTRLLHILVSLVNAKDGILLIDEFENGLHWSIQPKVWEIVFYLADRLNVQVFATTHSRDCVEAFDRIWNQNPSLGAFLRLEAKDNRIKVTEYTPETLTDAIEMDVEVR